MTQPNLTEVHLRLAHAREQRGFATASDAARRFRWNENTYRSHENGERGLKIDVAYRYAKAFKVRLEWLLIGEENSSFHRQEGRLLTGDIDNEGNITYYPTTTVGNFVPILAFSDYFPFHESKIFEFTTTKPLLNCWPGDVISVMGCMKIIKTTKRINPGDLAIIVLENDKAVLRTLRLNDDRTKVDIQLYPEMGPIFENYKDLYLVECIIRRRAWGYRTLDEYQAELNDPYKKVSLVKPPRRP